MNKVLPGGRFFVPLNGIEYYFEETSTGFVHLIEAVDSETGERIPTDTVEVPDRVESSLEAWGVELDERPPAASLVEAM